MNVAELVGKITAEILRDELQTDSSGDQTTARFVLNLSAEQTAAVAKAVQNDPFLNASIELKLPRTSVGSYALPEQTLTDLHATYYRNASCPKSAFLLAYADPNEEASIGELAQLGQPELLDRIPVWIQTISAGLALAPQQQNWWQKALTGLRDLRIVSLDGFAAYVLRTRYELEVEARPMLHALGAAFPAIQLPSDPPYFEAIKERSRGQASEWKRHFNNARNRRASLLLKQTSGQILLTEEELKTSFDKVRHQIAETYHPTIEAFIVAPCGWNDQAADLAECNWEEIKPIFDGLQRERFDLGRNTLQFYDDRDSSLLTDDEREYIKGLVGRKTSEDIEEDTTFYETHRSEIKDDRQLKSAWDRFVYGRPVENTDFLAGLCAALEPLYNRMPIGTSRKLKIRCESATKHEFKALNVDAGLYFAHRYAGLKRLFGANVEWNVGELFNFKKLIAEWRAGRRVKLNTSTAKAALQLKFVVELHTMNAPPCSTQLVWRYDASCVASQLADDWDRLTQKPFTACRTSRELIGDGAIDIANVKTFMPAYDRDRGSFVPAYKRDRDLAIAWRANLKECVDQAYLSTPSATSLEATFAAFEAAYTAAIATFPDKGSGSAALLDQTTAYARLIDAILTLAKGDRNRDKLLKPVLEIGTVPIDGGTPAVIITPWHPLRLTAMWRKSKLAADLIRQLLATETPEGDTKLFFRDVEQDFKHPLYPELAIIWTSDSTQLLSVTDATADYSLHELPVVELNGHNDTNESPLEGSACVLDLVRRYLTLHPHERASMSVVLFNCDSARLPQAVVEKIATIQDDDEDVRCQVLLRHIDGKKLREVYRSILDADTTADAYSASEVTQDFMARLRISVIADQAPPPDPKDGCPYDIVFSQDVISRHAQLEWYLENAEPADVDSLLPSRWSRRRPAARDDLKSAVFLCCPIQSAEGWSYLTALATFFKGDWDGSTSKRFLPVRQLDFRDGRTNRIFEETHDLGKWVVNYDELLDRRQLLNQQVRVIRYKQVATQGRALIISSRASLTLLRSMILHRLTALNLELDEADLRRLADRLIDDANDMSGDIVLRAATRGQSASELIGIVLSRQILRDELKADQPIGWYFLDDYAGWIGQKEQQIADLLAIQPRVNSDGKLHITLAVSEAKYIELDALAAKRKESQKQLRDTLDRLEDAVFGNPERLDRQSWLARIADLMLDGIRIPAASGIDLGEWRRAMREGRCEIELRGVSHVFVPTAGDGNDVTEATEVAGAHAAYQEIFGRKAVKQLLLAYRRNETTALVRRGLGFDHMDNEPYWRAPGSGLLVAPPQRRQARHTAPQAPPPAQPAPAAVDPVEPAPQRATPEPASTTSAPSSSHAAEPTAVVGARWSYTSISSLLPHPGASLSASEADAEWLSSTANATKSALQQLQLQAKLVGSSLTPNSALLRFVGSANMTVDLVVKKRSELLTTFGLNVISVRPEPGAVVVAVERDRREIINIRSLWAAWLPAIGAWGNQELLIGVKENDGRPLFLSPAKDHAPHTLIAGSTGSGKSVLMQAIILAIAATNTPEQARIVLIDPKQGVDYFSFEGLPHLDGGLIDNQVNATTRLEQLVVEMDRRYGLFREARVPNLTAYNTKVAQPNRLPVVWLIHDEFAEWMLTEDYKGSVSSIVQRLGVKARAAGIYLVFAAQRPDANVMPMQLRANLGNRLILRVDSEGTSEIALGEKGAERLLGKGHLLAKLEGEQRLIYAQVPMVDMLFADEVVAATMRIVEPA